MKTNLTETHRSIQLTNQEIVGMIANIRELVTALNHCVVNCHKDKDDNWIFSKYEQEVILEPLRNFKL
jgi:hypothetical protein